MYSSDGINWGYLDSMSREGRYLCVEKMDVAASSLRYDLHDNGHDESVA